MGWQIKMEVGHLYELDDGRIMEFAYFGGWRDEENAIRSLIMHPPGEPGMQDSIAVTQEHIKRHLGKNEALIAKDDPSWEIAELTWNYKTDEAIIDFTNVRHPENTFWFLKSGRTFQDAICNMAAYGWEPMQRLAHHHWIFKRKRN